MNTPDTTKNPLHKLIAHHCPDGVEFRELGEISYPQRGKRLVKSQLEKLDNYAVYQNSMKPLGFYKDSNVSPKTVFIICAGSAGKIGYSDKAFWAG